MGFKLPGKSIQSGTSGHSTALKMVAEQRAASALKMQASPAKSPEYDKAAKKDSELGNYVAERKKIKAKYGGDKKKYRASEEYKANQNKINKAYGIDDGYVAPAATTTVQDDPLTKEIKDISDVKKAEGPREGTKKEKVAVVKDNLKDTKKQNKINTLKGKKDVADAKGKSKRSQRLANKIERKESRLDGDKSTNVSKSDQRRRNKRTAKQDENSEYKTSSTVERKDGTTKKIVKTDGRVTGDEISNDKHVQLFRKTTKRRRV